MSVATDVTGSLPTSPHPACVAMYRFFDASDDLLYIGICREPLKRWYTHAHKPWWSRVETFRVVWFPSRKAAELAEMEAIRAERPRHNTVFNGVPYNGSQFPGALLYGLTLERFGNEPFSLKDLEDELGVPYSSALVHVRKLEEEGRVQKLGKMRTRPGRPLIHFKIVNPSACADTESEEQRARQ